MGTTADGLPYPVGTDPVTNGDDAIKALADAIQLRGFGKYAQYGRINLAVSGGNVRLDFPKRFAAIPVVFLCGAATTAGPWTPVISVNNTTGEGLSATSATLYVLALRSAQPVGSFTGTLPTWYVAIGAGPLV
jgi:hypothetical protein